MTENIIQRMVNNDLLIRLKIKNGDFVIRIIEDSKQIILQLYEYYLIYDRVIIKYKDIEQIKEYINEPTIFIYNGKRYAIIRSPDINIMFYQNFINALKLKLWEYRRTNNE